MIEIPFFVNRALGILSKVPREVWYILAALAAWWVFSNHYEQQGYDKRTAEYAEIARQAQIQADKSLAAAVAERANDTTRITEDQQERSDAIQNTQDSRPSDASNALNCERMRKAGSDISQLPACRGR